MNTNWWTGASPRQKTLMGAGAVVLAMLVVLVVFNIARSAPTAAAEGQTTQAVAPPWAPDAWSLVKELEGKFGIAPSCSENNLECFEKRVAALNAAAASCAECKEKLAMCQRRAEGWRGWVVKHGKPAKPGSPVQATATPQNNGGQPATPIPERDNPVRELWAWARGGMTQTQRIGDVSGGDAQVGDVSGGSVGDITIQAPPAPNITFNPTFSPTFSPTLHVTPGGTTVILYPIWWGLDGDICPDLQAWYLRQADSWKQSTEGVAFLAILMQYCGPMPTQVPPTVGPPPTQPPVVTPTPTPVGPPTVVIPETIKVYVTHGWGLCSPEAVGTDCNFKIVAQLKGYNVASWAGQWVELSGNFTPCAGGLSSIFTVVGVKPISNPCDQPTATPTQVVGPPTQPPATPTETPVGPPTQIPRCGPNITKYGGPSCRWVTFQQPVVFCMEKTQLGGGTGTPRFRENCFFMPNGYTGYILEEGESHWGCPPESLVQDMREHIARRAVDPEFVRDGGTIGEVSETDARTWGILADQCPPVAPPPGQVCPNDKGQVVQLPIGAGTHDVNSGRDKIYILKVWTNRPGKVQTTFRVKGKVDQPIRLLPGNGGDVTYWDPACPHILERNWADLCPDPATNCMPEKSVDQLIAEGYAEWIQ